MNIQEDEPTARHTFSLFSEHHPPQVISELLLTHQQPFTLRGVPADADEPSKPVLATRWRPHDGDMFVWLKNNVTIYDAQFAPTEKPIIDGFFMLDRRPNMTKLLFLPHHGMFGRDTFRGWGNGFETQSSLLDIINALTRRGVPIYQATFLRDLETLRFEETRFKPHEIIAFCGRLAEYFRNQTGMDSMQAYRLEGELTIQDVLEGNLHEVHPLTHEDLQKYRDTSKHYAEGWNL